MANKPTKDEIAAEIAKLRELRGKVPPVSSFGDDNVAAIGAQIMVLKLNLDADRYRDIDYSFDYAAWAAAWRDGYEDEPPSTDWAELVKE